MTDGAFEEIRLPLAHMTLAARLYGPSAGHPVIALHGWLDNAASFARLAPRLPGVRLLALELPGHGHSDHRPAGSPYPLWDYLTEIVQVADRLGWSRFALLGHSMGAILGVLLAASLPERVARLALIDGLFALTTPAEQAPRQLGEALRATLTDAPRSPACYASLALAVKARLRGRYRLAPAAAELLVRRGLVEVPGGYAWRSDPRLRLPSPVRLSEAQARAFAEQVSCPVRLVLAEAGLFAAPEARRRLDGLPFERFWLPGGHHLHLDDDAGADAVAAVFRDFLQA